MTKAHYSVIHALAVKEKSRERQLDFAQPIFFLMGFFYVMHSRLSKREIGRRGSDVFLSNDQCSSAILESFCLMFI